MAVKISYHFGLIHDGGMKGQISRSIVTVVSFAKTNSQFLLQICKSSSLSLDVFVCDWLTVQECV